MGFALGPPAPTPPATAPSERLVVEDAPSWLLFPSTIPREVYKPKRIALPSSPDDPAFVEVWSIVRKARFFRSLTDRELEKIVALGKVFEYPRYSQLVREGTPGASCFVVLSGSMVAFSSHHVGVDNREERAKAASGVALKQAETFGEAGLLADVTREATISCSSVCRVFVLDRGTIDPAREAWRRPEVTNALQATPEWGELRQTVIARKLEVMPFFGALVASRRATLAALMKFEAYDTASVIFREGDEARKFYIVADGAVEIHKAGGKFSGSRVVSLITHSSDRPWFGEVALWLRKPRAGTAVVVSEPECKLLVIDEINFDAFLANVPDFRPYLNKNHSQASVLKSKAGTMSVEAAMEEDAKLEQTSAVAMQWQSGGRLGGRNQNDMSERSVYAERWERLVTALLYMPSESSDRSRLLGSRSEHSTVSFRTCDYMPPPPSLGGRRTSTIRR